MIGSGLKKLAKENGMKIAGGYAYGSFRGYDCAFSEGAGYKLLVVSTRLPDTVQEQALQADCEGRNLQKEFRVQELYIGKEGIAVNFLDNPGTMKRMVAFCDWFFPLLAQYSATPAGVCPECGMPISGEGKWMLTNGIARHMHESCGAKMQERISHEETRAAEEDTGSYGAGFLGAMLGSLIGAIPWALLYLAGRIAAVLGLLIGWLGEKGYCKLGGKNGKAKALILIVTAIISVCVGNFLGEWLSAAKYIFQGEAYGLGYGDILPLMFALLVEDAEYCAIMLKNILMGLFFAALGIFAIIRNSIKAASGSKFRELP